MSSALLNLKTEPSPIPFPMYGSPSSGGGGSIGSPGGCGSGGGGSGGTGGSGGGESKMFLSHGGRPTKGNGRKRKGVDEYAAENRIDFTSRSIIRDGQLVRILVCRFCCQSIGARSDRIKEHLASKRHQKLKLEAFREAAEAGRDLSQEFSDDSASGLLPEPPITMLKFPGKALVHLMEGERDGRQSSHELTPEPEDRRQTTHSPPPLRDFRMNSPPPSTPLPIPGIRGSNQSSRNSPPPPPPPIRPHNAATNNSNVGNTAATEVMAPQPHQLLCVRWGNYDSNIVSMFSKLRTAEHFVDVTLWCEGRTIKCHKIVLSACSVYFEKLLVENQNVHPIIFLKDMKYWEIEALVEFMYKGETSIQQDKLQSLLRAAESLQIKGLGSPPSSGQQTQTHSQNQNNDINNNNSSSSSSSNEIPQHRDTGGGVLRQSSTVHHFGNRPRPSSPIEDHHQPLQHLHHSGGGAENSMDMPSSIGSGNFNLTIPRGNSPMRSTPSSQNMGMDLSNHQHHQHHSLTTSNLHQSTPFSTSSMNTPNSLSSSFMSLQHSSAKRRKREIPRRIGIIPRMAHGSSGAGGTPSSVPHQLLPPGYSNPMATMDIDDGAGCSDDDSDEAKPQKLISVNGAGSDDDSIPEPRPLIMADKMDNSEIDYGDADSDEDGDHPPASCGT